MINFPPIHFLVVFKLFFSSFFFCAFQWRSTDRHCSHCICFFFLFFSCLLVAFVTLFFQAFQQRCFDCHYIYFIYVFVFSLSGSFFFFFFCFLMAIIRPPCNSFFLFFLILFSGKLLIAVISILFISFTFLLFNGGCKTVSAAMFLFSFLCFSIAVL